MDSAIVNTMEVLETKALNELVSECVIKVCWVGDKPNPNNTQIPREVGKEIAASLPGAPVAGFFNRETGDFEEHSRKVTISNGEINFEDITKAYGFVSPMDQPWYQDFMEDGEVRTYLMCKAFLWTRQYEEAALAFDKGQSMELDEKTMSGYYEGDVFVFSSVTLDKLCILGDAYAPCFAGAKIMTTYAKQYESLAEKLEKYIGRRYYVMNNELVVKEENATAVALSYAVELGWNLTDAIYLQLRSRGAENYNIEGIYSGDSQIFAILKEMETQELVKVNITINTDQTVTLDSEMVAVTMEWVPKAPATAEPVESLSGETTAVATQEVPMNVAATYAEGDTTDGGGETAAPSTEFAEVVNAGTPTEGTPTAEPTPEAPTVDVPSIDYAAEYDRLIGENAVYTEKINAANEKIAYLEAQIADRDTVIAAYRAAEAEAVNTQKADAVASYTELLAEEEIAPVKAKLDEYTLDEVETQLALTFAKKAKATKSAVQFQLNVTEVTTQEADLPDFIKQAAEFDKARELKL